MSAPDEASEKWLVDEEAGPLVRPYAMTRGRTRPASGRFNLISMVKSSRSTAPREPGLGPEHIAIIRFCQRPKSVAEIAAQLDLPAGTIRVMLGDLLEQQLVQVREPHAGTSQPHESIYEAAINGLRAL